jgi:DNA-binding LacI/PurR family transcriptional regulator
VSLSTASRALNDAYGVSPTTRQRVLDVARQLDYVVSPEASRLAGGATGRVALVVPHVERWYFGAIIGGLEHVLSAAGLDVLLYHVGDADDRRRFFNDLPVRRKVDGVVVVAFPVDEAERQRLQLMGVTIVAAGGDSATYPHVRIDDEVASRQAVEHLLRLGHTRIGMITAVDPYQPARPTRSEGYYSALADAGIPIDEGLIVSIDWGGAQGADAMAQLLSLTEPPTAVYAHSDEVALGAMRTIRRAGLRVPEDISIVGVDDHPLADLVDLTTVRQPAREQGVLAARMLLALLRGEDGVDEAITLPTYLVPRRSTAPTH